MKPVRVVRSRTADSAREADVIRRAVKVTLGKAGRVVIPAPFRKALGLQEGDTIIFHLHDGEIRILTPRSALSKAQALVRRYVPQGVSLADELIRERRREAERE